MAAALTGLGSRPAIPPLPHCACGCGRDGNRGFPGDIHFAPRCIPPDMRFPWEAGYAPAAAGSAPAAGSRTAAGDLFPGRAPA